MLKLTALCASGERCSLPTPEYIELCRDEDAPADSLRVTFAQNIKEELAEIYITDGDEEIFCGVVDEQTFISYEGEQTEIVARSMAAVLLDNEAYPQNFVNPCAQVLFERYMMPYGIEGFVGEDKSLQGKFDVLKGMSCWQVAEVFGKGTFGAKPSVEGKKIVFSKNHGKEQVVFSNHGQGIPFTRFEHSKLRCKLLSKVRAKTQTSGGYDTVVTNSAAVSSGVVRERYLNASLLSGDTLSKAFHAIEKSLQNSQVITLKCPAQIANLLSAEAKVESAYGVYENFRVTSLRYVLSDSGEYTRVTLCRKEN